MRFLDKHALREKHLRRLDREAQRLRRAEGDAPVIPLERPYQRGWTKTYVLAHGIDRRPDAAIFRRLLAAVNRRVYSRERSFVHPRVLHFREVESYGWPASHLRLFEFGTWRIDDAPDWAAWRSGWSVGYKLIRSGWLREDVQPHLITHQRVDLPEVKSRLAEIEAYMAAVQGWRRLDRLYGRGHGWRSSSPHADERQALLSFAEQIGDIHT